MKPYETRTAEFSTGRSDDRRMPDGRPRPLSPKELARAERRASLRDIPLAQVIAEVRRGDA